MMRTAYLAAILAASTASTSLANPIDQSLRPLIRPDRGPETVALASAKGTNAMRPIARPLSTKASTSPLPVAGENARFQNWIGAFKDRAEEQGIDRRVLDRAFDGVRYDADVIRRDRNQSEFTKTIWDYLDTAVSDARIANGRKALDGQRATLEKIEATYGVEKEIVTAIWGLESAYGSFRGSNYVIESLATLAFDTRRARFFEEQLIEALKILQSGDTVPANMTGSWAGAMGHTQFMPTSYQSYAVDFTGDGKRDIWSDDPADALASTAAYLKHFGWATGQPWGVEVTIPAGFDYTLANRDITRLPSDWARIGVVDTKGQPVPDHGSAAVLLPAGGTGAAFLIFDNFEVIEHYNTADAYVIGVGHLADRIAGGPAIRSDWPREDRALTFAERKELQERLTNAGFDTQKIDGKIGPLTIASVRAYQLANGMLPDGYASLRVLKSLR